RFAPSSLAGDLLPCQIAADRLAVPIEVPGDGRNRPALLLQCMRFHVFFSCEHGEGLLLGLGLGHHKPQEGTTLGGGPSGHQGVHRWGIPMSRSGESYASVVTNPIYSAFVPACGSNPSRRNLVGAAGARIPCRRWS